MNKDKDYYISSNDLDEEKFLKVKTKIYSLFTQINQKYEQDQNINLMKKNLDSDKFKEFAEKNKESYDDFRVLSRIEKFISSDETKKDGVGYNTILSKEEFVKEPAVIYTNDNEFGNGLARSEDNEIIKKLLEKCEKRIDIDAKEVINHISKEEDFDYVVLWTENYFNIEDYNENNLFTPRWNIGEAKNKGRFFQGTIKNKDVYSIYRPVEYNVQDNIIILLKKDAFEIKEFIPLVEESVDNKLIHEFGDKSIYMSVKDLSVSPEDREEIINQWISKGIIKESEKEEKLEELKISVVFKFLKGIDISSLNVDCNNIKVIRLK